MTSELPLMFWAISSSDWQIRMNDFDLLIRSASVVTQDEVRRLDVGIAGGRITALEPELNTSTREIINADGLHVFPGLIDSHVHFNEPGRIDWEGFTSGSRSLAAGGATLFFDMPLNSHPPTIDGASFDKKLAAAEAGSLIDFALWGGLVPDNLAHLEELSRRGVIGFKAFMADSGIDDFPRADDRTLKTGMKQAAQLNNVVAVHAESHEMIQFRTEQLLSAGGSHARDFLASRPIEAELDAIERALEMAGGTGCALHIVHVSCGAGIALISSARKHGVNVTCETCPHYLTLVEEDLLEIGALAKCAPPLRPKSAQDGLWEYLKSDQINTIGSDHSPAPPEMKSSSNFFKVWGGISGGQHTLPLLLTEGVHKRHLPLAVVARATSSNVAQRFRLPQAKRKLSVGADADLALVNIAEGFAINSADLLYRHRQTPYLGRALTGKVVQTILRGQTIFKNGRIISKPLGRLIKPVLD